MDDNNDDLYTNLLRATDNLQDIVFQRYATITATANGKYTLKELDSDLIHYNVPSITTDIKVGDTVLLTFTDNTLHHPLIIGSTTPTNIDELIITSLSLGLFKIGDDGILYVELPVNVENFFKIEDGVLWVDLPTDAPNNYKLKEDGILYYERKEI